MRLDIGCVSYMHCLEQVGRETIVGLLVALRLFVNEDPTERWRRHLGYMQELVTGLEPLAALGQCDS